MSSANIPDVVTKMTFPNSEFVFYVYAYRKLSFNEMMQAWEIVKRNQKIKKIPSLGFIKFQAIHGFDGE